MSNYSLYDTHIINYIYMSITTRSNINIYFIRTLRELTSSINIIYNFLNFNV